MEVHIPPFNTKLRLTKDLEVKLPFNRGATRLINNLKKNRAYEAYHKLSRDTPLLNRPLTIEKGTVITIVRVVSGSLGQVEVDIPIGQLCNNQAYGHLFVDMYSLNGMEYEVNED